MIIQLYVNLHTICTSNPTKISESKTYFNESVLLTPSRRKGKNSKIIPETLGIEAGMQKTAISAYGPGQTVTIKNLTDFPAYYFGAITADELIQPSSLMIPPHSESLSLQNSWEAQITNFL